MKKILMLASILALGISLSSCSEKLNDEQARIYMNVVDENTFNEVFSILKEEDKNHKTDDYTYKSTFSEYISREDYLDSDFVSSSKSESHSVLDSEIDYDKKLIDYKSIEKINSNHKGALGSGEDMMESSKSSFFQHHGAYFYELDRQSHTARIAEDFNSQSDNFKAYRLFNSSLVDGYTYYKDDNCYTAALSYDNGVKVGDKIYQIEIKDDYISIHYFLNETEIRIKGKSKSIINTKINDYRKISYKDVALKLYDMKEFKMI